jgi:hypothetical protein
MYVCMYVRFYEQETCSTIEMEVVYMDQELVCKDNVLLLVAACLVLERGKYERAYLAVKSTLKRWMYIS